MQIITSRAGRWLAALIMVVAFSSSAFAQRTVTLTLNAATIPDTTLTDGFMEVRGSANDVAPATLADGNMIDWSDVSTLEPTNIGGDYWQVQFQIADTTNLTFKFFSGQTDAAGLNGWEADPNPSIPAGTGDTTLTTHFFEVQGPFKDFGEQDKGDYDWRPYEPMEGHVAVWFRVFMNTESALNGGYDRADTSQVIGVRGDPLGGNGPLDWGATQIRLMPELSEDVAAGYHLFSGVAYYPDSLAGQQQYYKFHHFDGHETWEGNVNPDDPGREDRVFTIPSSDSTLHWKYFNNSTPASGAEQVTSTLLFAVDTSPLEAIGLYDRGRGDSLEVRGDFNGWGCADPTICELIRVPGEDLFEGAFTVTAFPETNWGYKFFINHNDENFQAEFGEAPPSGWEEPISTTGANRALLFEGSTEQDLGIQFFNDVLPGNIIPEGTTIDVTFQVRMDSALVDDAAPFDPAMDTVTVNLHGDALWAFSQGLYRDADGNYQTNTSNIVLTDDDQDGLYTGTFTVTGPTYGVIQYKYAFGGTGAFSEEAGGGFSDRGRRRTRFIAANADGSWPSEWTFEAEQYIPSGLLPFEDNPVATGVENVGGELPTQATLNANYPNPFNPTTTIEYSINSISQVSLKVFDLTGRLVATLVDGMQQPSNYRVDFDANNLASGVYMYRLETPNTTLTRKMILLK